MKQNEIYHTDPEILGGRIGWILHDKVRILADNHFLPFLQKNR